MADAAMRVRNAEAPWGDFSAQEYWRTNYQTVHPEDQEILRLVSLFFSRTFVSRERAERAIDVGSGANIYPALLMLPWADQILLTDYSWSNVQWLTDHLRKDGDRWDWQPFWAELAHRPGYDQVDEPRKRLKETCAATTEHSNSEPHVEHRSVFDLPRQQWQLGTMFFVAESITGDRGEFDAAVSGFVGALEPGAPFAATFMQGSEGYTLNNTLFPAIAISADDVAKCLTELGARSLSVHSTSTSHRVRLGYDGMIVATGIAGR